jgi:hypothetical protein
MSNTVYDLLYARLHTRKYTTGKMRPEGSTNRDVHNASLETNYEMTATMCILTLPSPPKIPALTLSPRN